MNNLVTKASELIYQMDNGQLNEVIEAVKLKRQHLSRQATRNIMVGDNFKNVDQLINGHQIFLNAECLPNYDYMEPDLETWQECHDIPEFDKPEYCKEKDFPILDNSDEQG